MLRALSLVVLIAAGCRPAGNEGNEPGTPAPTPGEAPSAAPSGTPSGTNGERGTDGARGTDDAMGSRGTDGTTPATPPAGEATPGTGSTPGTTGTPGTGQAPAVDAMAAAAQTLGDLHQLHVHELALATLATEKSTDPGVRSYAEQEAKDHMQADADLVKLASSKGITWGQADAARYQEQTAVVEKLRGLDGVVFDQAYLQETVQDHDHGYTLVESSLTTIQDPEIKAHLTQLQPILQAHRDRARQVRPGQQGT